MVSLERKDHGENPLVKSRVACTALHENDVARLAWIKAEAKACDFMNVDRLSTHGIVCNDEDAFGQSTAAIGDGIDFDGELPLCFVPLPRLSLPEIFDAVRPVLSWQELDLACIIPTVSDSH